MYRRAIIGGFCVMMKKQHCLYDAKIADGFPVTVK
jgi:hypothetical protein